MHPNKLPQNLQSMGDLPVIEITRNGLKLIAHILINEYRQKEKEHQAVLNKEFTERFLLSVSFRANAFCHF